MATDTTKITGAADELSAGLTKGGTAAKTLGAEIANAFAAQDARITALEAGATTPPVEPPITEPPPSGGDGPTGGQITSFNPANDTNSVIGGRTYHSWSANKNYSLKQIDDFTMRFEIRQGEGCATIYDNNCDRSMLDNFSQMFENNTVIKYAFRVMIEAGQPNNASWFAFSVQHNNDKQLNGKHTSGIFAVELLGEKFSVVFRHCRAGGNPENGSPDLRMERPWTDNANFKRGQWYVFELEARANQSGGYLKVKKDGTEVVNYSGPLGYGCQTYFVFGPYRNTQPQTFSAQFKNVTVG